MRPARALQLLVAAMAAACGAGGAGGTPAPPSRLAVGYAGDVGVVGHAGFHVRYQYLTGVLAPDPGCLDLARAKAEGCGTDWWGTWQWDQLPPGQFVPSFVDATAAAGLRPMFTWYILFQAAQARLGIAEGTPEVTVAARDRAFMAAYLADFRFFLQRLGGAPAIVHVEPDFWGYAQHAARAAGVDAHGLAAEVSLANPTDCASFEDSIAGLGRCMISMVRAYAPNALVSLHGSSWASGFDCVSNRQVSLDVAAEARKTADFLLAAGSDGADLVVVDLSDRDAGWYQTQGRDSWLDAGDRALPTFTQAFAWSKALADQTGKKVLWWQLPVGNMSLANTCDQWKDNKLDYFFDHPDRVEASGAVGMLFGSGATCQTSPETDGGHLKARAAALAASGVLLPTR